MQYLIGIDEAGRGPLAGPVSVGAVLVQKDFDIAMLSEMKDSKKLSPKKRETLFAELTRLRQEGAIDFAVEFSSSVYIDRYGIVPAIKSALARCLTKLGKDSASCEVLLDGGLKAPEEYEMQTTIIRGDATVPLISAASIAAKVLRDKYMEEIAAKYPSYGFEVHKGYGTAAHMKVIREDGLSKLHRATFCTNISVGLPVGSESV